MNTELQLSQGKLIGSNRRGHHAFLGIPFAGSTSGAGRFRPAPNASAWEGVLDATRFGNSCPQGHHRVPGMAASGPRAEDCLVLNIYTPGTDSGRRPVLLWIHGGGFTLGSGSELLYDGGHLAERGDVVVVTIHYRLGALGYAYFGKQGEAWGASANCGQLDQIEALKWVADSIGSFGGDSQNITVFGESAGASAVATLLAMPDAKGLFHKAILQSGAGGRIQNADTAAAAGSALMKSLDVCDFEELSAVDVDRIVSVQSSLGSLVPGFALRPVCDGQTLPDHPIHTISDGFASDIPVMIGTNRDEAKLFNVVPDREPISDEKLLHRIGELLDLEAEQSRALVTLFVDSRREHGLPSDNEDILDAIQTVSETRLPSTRFAEAQSRHQKNTFVYLFCWESPARRGALGSCHALEMPFVFGSLDAPTQDRFAGKGPDAEELAHNMMDAWINFARNSDPSHRGIGTWHPFDTTERHTMIFDRDCGVAQDPFSEQRLAIEEIL